MIEPGLLAKLIERNIVRETTEIEASYVSNGIGPETIRAVGVFVVTAIEARSDSYIFEARDVVYGVKRRIHGRNVRRIDGMDGKRIGQTYGLSETGEPLKVGKRRGRKPKSVAQDDV